MKCNVGGIERPIRMVLGLVLIAIGSFADLPPVGTGIAFVAGTIALVTGVIGFCPVWALFGLNTCPTKNTTDQTSKPA
ncbi:MAG: YgaP family membrane protein [Nitrospiraceae bacterium]